MKFLKMVLPLSVVNAFILLFYTLKLPESVPVHMNAIGVVDRFGSRWTVFGFGCLPIVLSIGLLIYWKYSSFQKNRKVAEIILPCIVLLFMVIPWPVYSLASDKSVTIGTKADTSADLFIFFVLGIFLMIISNFMAVIKPNRTLGIRVPWTLKNELVWKKTHRLGGYTGMLGGFVISICALISYFSNEKVISVVGIILGLILIAVIPIVYSYRLYHSIVKK